MVIGAIFRVLSPPPPFCFWSAKEVVYLLIICIFYFTGRKSLLQVKKQGIKHSFKQKGHRPSCLKCKRQTLIAVRRTQAPLSRGGRASLPRGAGAVGSTHTKAPRQGAPDVDPCSLALGCGPVSLHWTDTPCCLEARPHGNPCLDGHKQRHHLREGVRGPIR